MIDHAPLFLVENPTAFLHTVEVFGIFKVFAGDRKSAFRAALGAAFGGAGLSEHNLAL